MKRINNLEFKQYKSNNNIVEIIKWIDNIYFGKEEQYHEWGYIYNPNRNTLTRGNHSIAQECFVNKETCYTLALVELDSNELNTELRSVGYRLLELDRDEREIFFNLYELAHRHLLSGSEEHA